jgi:hypothetical protein
VLSGWCLCMVNRWVASDYLLLVVQFAGMNNSLAKMLHGIWVVLNVPVFCCQSLHRTVSFKSAHLLFPKSPYAIKHPCDVRLSITYVVKWRHLINTAAPSVPYSTHKPPFRTTKLHIVAIGLKKLHAKSCICVVYIYITIFII